MQADDARHLTATSLPLLLNCRKSTKKRLDELKQFIISRPKKTNDTYWPLIEKVLVSAFMVCVG